MKPIIYTFFILFTVYSAGIAQNNALTFDGTNEYVNCGSTINADISNQITISAWVYAEFNAYGDRGIVTNYWYTTAPSGGAGIFAWTTTGDNHKWSCFISTQSGGVKTIYSTNEIVTGVWTHVAMTYDNNVLRLYVNGKEVASEVCGAGLLENPSNNNPFYIAKHSYGTNCFNGKIDEVRIWNDARTAIEIRKNMYRELADPVSEANLVAYYKFNETTGTTLADSKGTNTGTLYNMAGNEWTPSLPLTNTSNALNFDGINDYVLLDDLSIYTGLTSLTVEAWVYPTAAAGWHEVFQVLPNNITLALSGISLYGFINDNAAGTQNSITIANAVTLNEWNHIAMTWDSSTGEHILYANGVEIGSISNASTDALVAGTGGPYIGTLEGSSEMYQGAIDELRIWNTALSATQIRDKMCEELNGDESGLIGYYCFNQTFGPTLLDITSSNNHGTLTNMDDSDWISSGAFIYDPDITTQAVTSISTTTATGNGNITNLGNPAPTAHGICWNTTGSPTIADSKTDEGAASATGSFTSAMGSLITGETYYVRAFATNTAGTSYGDEVRFTTLMDPPGNALNFNGIDSYINTTNILTTGSTSHTFEVWVKVPLVGTGNLVSGERVGIIFGNYDDAPTEVVNYEIYDNGQVRWYIGGVSLFGTRDLRDNKWHHLAFIRDKTADKLSIYIDGELDIESASAGTDQTFVKAQIIGKDHRSSGIPYFHGEMDELRIWDDVRTLTEIRDNMDAPLMGNETNLITYYKFDHLAGTTLDDLTSYANEGTTVNQNWVSSESMLYDPTAIAASNVTENSFTANWKQNYTASKYYLDVSTASDFSSFVTGYQDLEIGNGTTTSQVVSGLNPSADYYYRVRAYNENTSATSSSSNVQSLTTQSLYYMAKTDGNWSTTSIWYTNTTGGTDPGTYTTAATEAPTAANSEGIIINANVAVDANVSIDQATVNTGKTLTVNNGVTLSVSNGGGDDLTITGAIVNNGTVATATLSSVVYNGGDQTVLALNYDELSFAGSTAGSTKTFEDGTTIINNEIALNDNITLSGSSSDAVTVQVTTPGSGGTDSRVFYINASGKTVNISNMTIKGGDISGNGDVPSGYGGSIKHEAGTLNISLSVITGSKATYGGGIFVDNGAEINISQSTISNATSTFYGGGICVANSSLSELFLSKSIVTNNTSGDYGGGISTGISTTIVVENSTISGNMSNGYGGGISVSSVASVSNSTIANNISDWDDLGNETGGGMYLSSGDISIKNSIIANNYRGNVTPMDDDYDYSVGNLTDNGYNVVEISNVAANGGSGFNASTSILYNTKNGDATTVNTSWTQGGADLDNQNLNLSSTLADNGCPTETLALTSGSFAIGAIPYTDDGSGVWNGSPTTAGSYFEQRGVETTFPNPVSVGAVSGDFNNTPPVANDTTFYHYYNSSDESFTIAADGVLDNDADTESDALTAVLDTDVSKGTLTLNSNGSFTYDFTGLSPDITETFTYYANDGNVVSSSTATVTINVLTAKFIGPGTDFDDPDNWNCGYVPDETLDIVIAAGEHMDVNADFTCRTLMFEAGSSFKCINGKSLSINGNILNRHGNVSIEIFSPLVVYSSIEINNQ